MQCKAIVQRGTTLVKEDVTLPALEDHQILVRVRHAALNPTDGLAFGLQAFGDGAVLGCDFAGEVEQIGSAVSRFVVGDKIAAFIWGGEVPGVGAFSTHCIADEAIAFRVPDNITMEQAATIPLAATTAWLAFYAEDCLNIVQGGPSGREKVVVLGGSSSVGSFANQIGAAHNIDTVSTCSKKNVENVRSDGAQKTFDYNDPEAMSDLEANSYGYKTIFDTIGNAKSVSTVEKILHKNGGKMCIVRPGKAGCEGLPDNIDVSDVFVFTVFLKEHNYRGKFTWPPNPKNHALGKQFMDLLPSLISDGKIKPRPVKSMGQLSAESVLDAISLVKEGKVSNEKLCFSVPDSL